MLNHAQLPEAKNYNGSVDDVNYLRQLTENNFLSTAHLFSLSYQSLLRSGGSVGVVSAIAGRGNNNCVENGQRNFKPIQAPYIHNKTRRRLCKDLLLKRMLINVGPGHSNLAPELDVRLDDKTFLRFYE